MTNIFNKKVLVRNGTLISNWYEEQVLREATGEGRTIPKSHLPKKYLDFDTDTNNKRIQDDTKTRILGTKLEAENTAISRDYGNFPKKNFEKLAIKDKIFLDFFKSYLNQGKVENDTKISNNNTFPVNNNTNNFSSLGKNTKNTCFVDPKIDKFVPFYQSKEGEYWDTSLKRMNKDGENGRNLEELMFRINEKIQTKCREKGWLGMRNLRNYLLNSYKKMKIPKFNFKFYLTNLGIFLTDQEVNAIYTIYDEKNKDEICFNTFLNSLIVSSEITQLLNETRSQNINSFISQLNSENGLVKDFEKQFISHYHPDVMKMKRSTTELTSDFMSVVSSLKEKQGISLLNLESLLRDISYAVESDEEFIWILVSWYLLI